MFLNQSIFLVTDLVYLGEAQYSIKIKKDDLERCQKTAKIAEKLALNLVEYLLSPEELATVTVYGNVQHKKLPMAEEKTKALRSKYICRYMYTCDVHRSSTM